MMIFEERIAWIINIIKEKEKLNNNQLAKLLGVNKNTIAAYSEGKGDLKGKAIAAIVKHFSINGEWLIAGNGEPWPGAREKYRTVCGPPPIKKEVYDKMKEIISNVGGKSFDAQQININEAMGMTYQILSSGTPFAVALLLNIKQFSHALDMLSEINLCKEELAELKDQMEAMRHQIENLAANPQTATAQEEMLEKKAM